MKQIISFSLIMLSCIICISQSNTMEKVPKQKTIDIGYRYMMSNNFQNKADYGYSLEFDYAWKLSGFVNKKAVFISIPLGYTYLMPKDTSSEAMRLLSYGWTVRHELAKNKKIIPFLGYGLLLNQLSINKTDGGIMGHQTRFEFGVNFNRQKKIIPMIKIEYTYSSFPSLGEKKRKSLQYLELKGGIRF